MDLAASDGARGVEADGGAEAAVIFEDVLPVSYTHLKKLNDEYSALLDKEQRSRDFRAAMGEDIESVRPA